MHGVGTVKKHLMNERLRLNKFNERLLKHSREMQKETTHRLKDADYMTYYKLNMMKNYQYDVKINKMF